MQIDPSVEEPTRKLFGHAIRAELDGFERQLGEFDERRAGEALRLATLIAGAVALEVNEGRQPSDADLRLLAQTVAKAQIGYTLTEDQVHTYLSRCVFGGENLDELFGKGEAVALPFLVTGTMLGSYTHRDQGQKWWQYLDQIEGALEATPDAAP